MATSRTLDITCFSIGASDEHIDFFAMAALGVARIGIRSQMPRSNSRSPIADMVLDDLVLRRSNYAQNRRFAKRLITF